MRRGESNAGSAGDRRGINEGRGAHTVVEENAGLGEVGVALHELVDALQGGHVRVLSRRKSKHIARNVDRMASDASLMVVEGVLTI